MKNNFFAIKYLSKRKNKLNGLNQQIKNLYNTR